jgi:multidrug efflux pump subunit AcrB
VTEVGIFYVSELADLDPEAPLRERLIEAGSRRARAITMTTLAAILALLPLALAISAGSALQQPLAIAIIAGLIVQLPLVLILLPALILMFSATKTK